MHDGRRPHHTAAAPSPRQPSQALARSIEDELISASVNTPLATSTASRHSGRSSTALVRTALEEEAPHSSRPSQGVAPVRSSRGPLMRAESRETTAPAPAPPQSRTDTAATAAWNISFGGPSAAPGTKRRRKPSPQAANLRARLEGRTAVHADDKDDKASRETTAPPVAVVSASTATMAQASGMPTPPAPPPRRRAVLLETPLFIREEREATAAAAAASGAAATGGDGGGGADRDRKHATRSPAPAPASASLFSRALSQLRTSASVVIPLRESTVRSSQSRARRETHRGPKRSADASPWDLSTIPSASTRRGQQPRHAPSDRAGSRWSDGSSSVSSFARTEMLNFLEPSVTGVDPHAYATASAVPPAVLSTTAPGRGAAPFPNCDPRYAALSSISSSLADIVSSSRSSLHSSLAAAAAASPTAPPPPHVDGTTAQAGSHSSGARPSDARARARSPTIMEPPNVSSIHGDEPAIRRRQQARLARHQRAAVLPEAATQHRGLGGAGGGSDRHTVELPAVHAAGRGYEPMPGSAQPPPPPSPQLASQAQRPSARDTRTRPSTASSTTRSTRLSSRLATLTRALVSAALVLVFVLGGYCVAAPMLVDLDGAQDTLTRYYVNPVSELHALYRVAPSSLSEGGVRQLYGRALSEGVERLERSTAHLADVVRSSTRADHVLYLQQLVRAYIAVQHRARLYARSRDGSAWRRLAVYPLADAVHFGIARHGLRYTARRLVRKPSWRYLTELGRGAVNCLAQNEELPCPTVRFVEQSMMILSAPDPDSADDEESVLRDVNAGLDAALGLRQRTRGGGQWPILRADWHSEVYLETLLTFIRETIRQSTRDYNHRGDGSPRTGVPL